MANSQDVIYEAWFYKLSGTISSKEKNNRRVFKTKGSWKEKYFTLVRQEDQLYLQYYDKQPCRGHRLQPRERICLSPSYRLEKLQADHYVCLVATPSENMYVGASDQSSIDTFAFNLQTQTVLRDNLEGTTFAVLPENSLDNERLLCVGSVCSLHISPWGVSLALQLTRSLIAHWPLKCIRCYESDNKGSFNFESGRKAPFGQGTYTFQTRKGQDDHMYNLLDNYVVQATSLADNYPTSEAAEEIGDEYDHLKHLTVVHPQSRESIRASRTSGMYDHIFEKYGGLPDEPKYGTSQRSDVAKDSSAPQIVPRRRKPDVPQVDLPVVGETNDSDLIKWGAASPTLASPPERRQVMITQRTLMDSSLRVSNELPLALSDMNHYEDPDRNVEDRVGSSPVAPGTLFRMDSNQNQVNPYEDPDKDHHERWPYDEPGMPTMPPPPPPTDIIPPRKPGQGPRGPPPPPPVGTDVNLYADPDLPTDEPPPPLPQVPPPVPPFPVGLGTQDETLEEYADMTAPASASPLKTTSTSRNEMLSSLTEDQKNRIGHYKDPYSDATLPYASGGCASDMYVDPDEVSESDGLPTQTPSETSQSVQYAEEDYLKMNDLRKSAPVPSPRGRTDQSSSSKSRSMYEIVSDQPIVAHDIDIDTPVAIKSLPKINVTPVSSPGVSNQRRTLAAKLSHGNGNTKMSDDENELGYLLLPPKLSRSRIKSQSCEELGSCSRRTEPNEEGYFEIDDMGKSGEKEENVPMPFTGLVDMNQLGSPDESREGRDDPERRKSLESSGGHSKKKSDKSLTPFRSRFQRSISNPDVARKDGKSRDEKHDESHKKQSRFGAFLYGTLRKKKNKHKTAESEGSSASSHKERNSKALSPPEMRKKPDEKSPKEKAKRKTSAPPRGSKDIIGGIEISPKGRTFVKAKPPPESSGNYAVNVINRRPCRSSSPNFGRRLPSLPADIEDRELSSWLGPKHAQSHSTLI